jgi:hypothetical protein
MELCTAREQLDRLLRAMGSAAAPVAKFEIQPATERRLSPRLTIGMATFDDYDGVYFSLQTIRLFHAEVLEQVEFLVIDNHPDGACGQEDSRACQWRGCPGQRRDDRRRAEWRPSVIR